LVADGELVLEEQRQVLAQARGAALLVLDDARAERVAFARIGLERKQAFALDHRWPSGSPTRSRRRCAPPRRRSAARRPAGARSATAKRCLAPCCARLP